VNLKENLIVVVLFEDVVGMINLNQINLKIVNLLIDVHLNYYCCYYLVLLLAVAVVDVNVKYYPEKVELLDW